MKHLITTLVAALALLGAIPSATAQIVPTTPAGVFDTDSIQREFANKQFYFGAYRDNYFIFGPPIGYKPNKENTNIKFQISVAQKLTKNTLPWGTYLYLFYTQKVFWNVLENSMPMTDLNFNPGVGLIKPLFVKDRYIGKLGFVIEHESNGKDSIWSRSWNKITFSGNFLLTPDLYVGGSIWIPIVDGKENKDILNFKGLWDITTGIRTRNRKFTFDLILTRRAGKFFNYNTTFEITWNPWKSTNQSFFLQYYNGYGEDMLDYKQFKSQLRVGFVIKPGLFSDF